MNRLLSPEHWIGVFCGLCLTGIILVITGTRQDVAILRITGIVLIAPLLSAGVALGVVVIPILILANRRQKGPPNP